MAVEYAVDPALEAALQGVEELRGDEDGDDQAPLADCVGQMGVDLLGDERHDGEIGADQRARRQSVGNAALEDEVGVHEPVADDGPTEGEGEKDEGEPGDFLGDKWKLESEEKGDC